MAACSGPATGGTVHVALGKSLKKGKLILDWVFKNLRGVEIVILHVHQPPKLIPMQMGGRFPLSMASPVEAEKYISKKRAEMKNTLQTFLNLCAKEKMPAKEMVIEAGDIYRGIVYLVGQHQIKRIVLGLRSIKEHPILEKGLLSCQMWLISNGKLVFGRGALVQPIFVEFSCSDNNGSSASSSSGAGGSSDFPLQLTKSDMLSPVSRQAAKEDRASGKKEFEDEDVRDFLVRLSEEADVISRRAAKVEREEESDDDFIEFSLPEIEEAAAKWLLRNGDMGR